VIYIDVVHVVWIIITISWPCICIFCTGLAAVIYIDVVQVGIMLGGSSLLLYRGLDKVGGWTQLQHK
jgi:Na+/pantothenate symporter